MEMKRVKKIGTQLRVAALGAAVFSAGLIATPVLAQNVAVVNGVPIPSERADRLFEEMNAQNPVPAEHQQRKRGELRERMIMHEVLSQEAKRQGVQTSPEYRDLLETARQTILITLLFKDFESKNKPSDAEIKAEYDRVTQEIGNRKEYKTSHILIQAGEDEAEQAKAKEEAKDLIKKLADGGDFAKLAKKHSDDPGSGAQGGDLGWADAATFVPEFSEAMKNLKVGETTQTPVKTQFGYHIIQLHEERAAPGVDIPPLEQVKDQIAAQMMREKLGEYQNKLRESAKVE